MSLFMIITSVWGWIYVAAVSCLLCSFVSGSFVVSQRWFDPEFSRHCRFAVFWLLTYISKYRSIAAVSCAQWVSGQCLASPVKLPVAAWLFATVCHHCSGGVQWPVASGVSHGRAGRPRGPATQTQWHTVTSSPGWQHPESWGTVLDQDYLEKIRQK